MTYILDLGYFTVSCTIAPCFWVACGFAAGVVTLLLLQCLPEWYARQYAVLEEPAGRSYQEGR